MTAEVDPDTIRSVGKLQIRSVRAPLDDPETAEAAVDGLKAMEAMGLLADDVDELTLDVLRSVATRAAEAGVGESAAASLRSTASRPPDRAAAALRELQRALEGSPLPAFEWPAMIELFGVERLAELVGVSVASLRRYAADQRPTPDVVAARLHLIARTRSLLGGSSPDSLLSGEWNPDGGDAERVLALARSITASPTT